MQKKKTFNTMEIIPYGHFHSSAGTAAASFVL